MGHASITPTAQPAPALPLRSTLKLTGESLWKFQPDVYDDGESLGYHLPDCDIRRWREVSLPCAFDDCMPQLAAYEGAVWFRREFDLTEAHLGKSIILRFEGANTLTTAWVNGRLAGEHRGGYLRFELPITRLAQAGTNTLVVRVDNTRRHGDVPGKERGWRPYGGILREIGLDFRPLVRIEQPVMAADADGSFECGVTVLNETDAETDTAVLLVFKDARDAIVGTCEPEVVKVPEGSAEAVILKGLVRNITAWTPDTPALYNATLRLYRNRMMDELEVWFGFRTIEARDGQLLLNGQPVRLRGFNRHEDSPHTGMTPDPDTAERDLQHMKRLGANFVRLCHYPHHPSTLQWCDRLGLLAMGEIPLYWWNGDADGDVPSTIKLANARQQLGEMIARDINHPALILWSVSNENHDQRPEVAAGNAELIELARQLDPSRLAVHVSDHWTTAPSFEADDVLCVNGYPSWSGRCWQSNAAYDFADSARWWRKSLERLHAQHPDRPILITEFGYPALYGVFGNALGEDTQAMALQAEADALADLPYVCGMTVWCYADHPWPEEDFIKRLTNSPFGVVTRDRRAKKTTELIPALFGAPPTPPVEPPDLDNAPVTMIRPHLRDIPEVPFPEGYSIRPMRPGEEGLWEDVQRDAEPFFTIRPGLFQSQFGDDPAAVGRRCYIITGPDGCAAGTISAWYLRDFKGQDYGRIHWVATRRAHQGKGLGRAGLSFALKQLARWHQRAMLDTSTGRVGAIKMYLDFGFVPDLDQPYAREAWGAFRNKLDHPGLSVLDQQA